MRSNDFPTRCFSLYRRTLLEDVVPFWMRHGIDRRYGGLSNALDDAGQPLNHDKFIWSQGRALWTFAALYRRIEKRAEWLDVAHHIHQYLQTHGRDEQGRWMYRLDEQGNVRERDTSIYADGFVLNGLGEYFVATGDAAARQLALATYENVCRRLADPGSYRVAPYTIPPGLKTHGIRMIFSFFFDGLGVALGRPDFQVEGRRLAAEILEHFYNPDRDAILEFVRLDGRFDDSPAGRTCVPGHALEALWFLIAMAERDGDATRIATCCRLIRRHLELAWDEPRGGLLLALDADGQSPCFWKNPDCKPWWVQVEALVATAYAWRHTGAEWCRQWHERIQEYAYSHYPVPTGEWAQWLDRDGRKMPSAGLPVKDPFHLPRALIYLVNLFGPAAARDPGR